LRGREFSGVIQNGSFFLTLAEIPNGFFSHIYCENLVKLLEVNLTKLWYPFPRTTFPRGFLTLKVVCTEPPAIHQLQFRFSCPHTDSQVDFHS